MVMITAGKIHLMNAKISGQKLGKTQNIRVVSKYLPHNICYLQRGKQSICGRETLEITITKLARVISLGLRHECDIMFPLEQCIQERYIISVVVLPEMYDLNLRRK